MITQRSIAVAKRGGQAGYNGWARQRASVTAICFEVYSKDFSESQQAKSPSITVFMRKVGTDNFERITPYFAGKRGTNLVYSFDLRSRDPLARDFDRKMEPQTYEFYFQLWSQSFGYNNLTYKIIYSH